MNIIIGKKSRLSSALLAHSEINKDAVCLETRTALYEISKFEPKLVTRIYCVGAITDPNCDPLNIEEINLNLPIKLRKRFPFCQLITFGTILEETNLNNPYVNSKRKLYRFLRMNKGNSIHFRLHTLYGNGKPKEHMFLGQLYECLKERKDFYMSSGKQFREYHHYDDVAQVVFCEINKAFTVSSINVSSGNSVQLLDLAYFIRDFLDIKIQIFSSETALKNEIYCKFLKNENINNNFRDSRLGVASYMKDLIDGNI